VDLTITTMTKLSFLCVLHLFNGSSALYKPHGHHDITRGGLKPNFGVTNDQLFSNKANDVALIVSGGATKIETTGISDHNKAKISFYADAIWSIANLAFLIVWLKPEIFRPNLFNTEFLKYGFCQNPQDVNPFNPTQEKCAVFDGTMACLTLLVGWLGFKLPLNALTIGVWGNAVAYPVAHGLAHFAIFKGIIKSTGKISWEEPLSVLALAAILAMGPFAVYTNMDMKNTPKSQETRIGIALAILAALVVIFVDVIQDAPKALLYINVTINLCIITSRLLLFGYKDKGDVDKRNMIFGPLFFTSLLTISLVILVMWIEPTMCDAWFSAAGGHIWFDVALIFMGLTAFANAILTKAKHLPSH